MAWGVLLAGLCVLEFFYIYIPIYIPCTFFVFCFFGWLFALFFFLFSFFLLDLVCGGGREAYNYYLYIKGSFHIAHRRVNNVFIPFLSHLPRVGDSN